MPSQRVLEARLRKTMSANQPSYLHGSTTRCTTTCHADCLPSQTSHFNRRFGKFSSGYSGHWGLALCDRFLLLRVLRNHCDPQMEGQSINKTPRIPLDHEVQAFKARGSRDRREQARLYVLVAHNHQNTQMEESSGNRNSNLLNLRGLVLI